MKVSVVVPARDEAPNLVRLHDEVAAVLDGAGLAWELVVVDDGSVDDTPAVLARLAADDSRVRSLRLSASQGQTAALLAGFDVARGEFVATLDADLQCPPDDIPVLLDMLRDADLACGIRTGRRDPWSRKIASAFSNLVRRALVAPRVHDLACPLRVLRRSALGEIGRVTPLFDGAHRWLPALFTIAGLRVVQRPVAHQPRRAGESKYTTRGRVRPVLRELGLVLRVAVGRPGRVRNLMTVGVLCLLAMPLLYGLHTWPLIEPDEGRNAEIAREMVTTGQWMVPHFDGLPYLDKPALFFWLVASMFRLVGIGEVAARLPSALAGMLTIVLTFALGRMLLGWRRALLAAVVVATSPIVLVYAHLVIFDLPLTALVTAALCCLVKVRLGGDERIWLPLSGLAMGLAVLTKGPVGVAIPLLVWLAGRGALPPRARPARWPACLAVLVAGAVVAPWVAAVAQTEPGFLRYALIEETFHRLTSSEEFHRAAPVYFYAETLCWALGIWGVTLAALVPALVRRWRGGGPDRGPIAFCVRGALALLVFFTLSASKRPHYLLPALVPIALLAAIAIDAERARAARVLRGAAWIAAPIGAAAAVAALAGVHGGGHLAVVSGPLLLGAGVCALAWATMVLVAGRRAIALLVCAALFAPALGFAVVGPMTTYAQGESSAGLARDIGHTPVVSFETFGTSLPFYLGTPVVLVAGDVHWLTSNYLLSRPVASLGTEIVSPDGFRALMAEDRPPLVVARRSAVPRVRALAARRLTVVDVEGDRVLLRPVR